jgi:hypothetical protein
MDSLTHVASRARGSAGLRVPAIGLGCMGFSQAYGPADEGESIATIRVTENAAAAALSLSRADLDMIEQVAPRRAWAGDRQSFAARHIVRTGRSAPLPPACGAA